MLAGADGEPAGRAVPNDELLTILDHKRTLGTSPVAVLPNGRGSNCLDPGNREEEGSTHEGKCSCGKSENSHDHQNQTRQCDGSRQPPHPMVAILVCTPEPSPETPKDEPAEPCLMTVRVVGARHGEFPPNSVCGPPRYCCVFIQVIVNDTSDVHFGPTNDPLKWRRDGAVIRLETSRNRNDIACCDADTQALKQFSLTVW